MSEPTFDSSPSPTPGVRSRRFAVVTVGVTVAIWAGLGAWLLIWPERLPASFGADATPALRTEVRAFYGGLELAIAAVLSWLVRRDLTAATLLGGLPLLLMGLSRLLGLAADAPLPPPHQRLHLVLMASELLGAGLNLTAFALLRRIERSAAAS